MHKELRQTAERLADAARTETLKYFRRRGLSSESKNPAEFDPVTAADRSAETVMRDLLARLRPDDGILGEEFGKVSGSSGLTWVLDPIDGTRGFICGSPTWGVLISVADANGPLLGIIDQPFTGERFFGGFGEATCTRGADVINLKTSGTTDLAVGRLTSTFPEIGSASERAAFQRVSDLAQLTRYGLDCYGYAMLAAGHIDLVIEAGLNPFDIHAPIAVIHAAGGVVTDWQGNPAHGGGRVLAAATSQLHAQALAVLNWDGGTDEV